MKNKFKNINLLVLLLVLIIFNLIIAYYFFNIINLTDGRYIYPLDDTYIHLSVAKNFAFYGNWGVVYNEFCSTSSSPVYTLILTLMIKIIGNSEYFPIILNIIFGNLIIIIIFYFFKKNIIQFLIVSFFLLTPTLLHIQVLSGMEHTLHILLIVSTFIILSKILSDNFNKKFIYLFFILVSFLCLTRYESMFFLSGIILIFLVNKKLKLALLTSIFGFIPMVLFGIYSISKGGFFFPNSLLLKAKLIYSNDYWFMLKTYLSRIIEKLELTFTIPIFIIISLIAVKFIKNYKMNFINFLLFLKDSSLILIVFITIVLHTLFASFGWLFRYEAYLYTLLFIVFVKEVFAFISNKEIKKNLKIFIAIIILPFFCIFIYSSLYRIKTSHNLISFAGKNIYEQQIQMSKFLKYYYNNSKVMANDIGAITYFTDIKILDLIGLGSNSILKQKKSDTNYTENFPMFITNYPNNQYKIIIIYDYWFGEDFKSLKLFKTAEWKINNNVICFKDKVSFYSTDSLEAEKLKINLIKFKNLMPKDVEVSIK